MAVDAANVHQRERLVEVDVLFRHEGTDDGPALGVDGILDTASLLEL